MTKLVKCHMFMATYHVSHVNDISIKCHCSMATYAIIPNVYDQFQIVATHVK